jgi:hypothetical protein
MTVVAAERAHEQIREVERREADARLRADVAVLDSLWSDSLIVNNPGNLLLNKSQNLALIKRVAINASSYLRETLKIALYGDTAIATGNETVILSRGEDAGSTISYNYMNVWRAIDSQWKLVARFGGVIGRLPADAPRGTSS